MRAVEGDRRLWDPYFYPLYHEAARLDLPMCIHASSGNFGMWICPARIRGSPVQAPGGGGVPRSAYEGQPEKFPDLRWAFIEVSSQWIRMPSTIWSYGSAEGAGRGWAQTPCGTTACMWPARTTDDMPYMLQYAGDENIVIGTDYGHNDTASELVALRKLREDGQIDPATADKFLDSNPKKLYGL